MSYLLDTNIIFELRKNERCDARVWKWRQKVALEEIFTSVLSMGELRRGIEALRGRDGFAARSLEKWYRQISTVFAERILPVTFDVAEIWAQLPQNSPLPIADGLIAATAIHHELILVTGNTKDMRQSGVDCLNPFID